MQPSNHHHPSIHPLDLISSSKTKRKKSKDKCKQQRQRCSSCNVPTYRAIFVNLLCKQLVYFYYANENERVCEYTCVWFSKFFVVFNLLLTCAIIFIALPSLPHRPYALCLFCLTSSVFVATIVITSIFPPSKYIHISERVDNIWKYHHQQKRHQQHQFSTIQSDERFNYFPYLISLKNWPQSIFLPYFFLKSIFFVYTQWLYMVSCWIFGIIWICSIYSTEDIWLHFLGKHFPCEKQYNETGDKFRRAYLFAPSAMIVSW